MDSLQPGTEARKHYDAIIAILLEAYDLVESRARKLGITHVTACILDQDEEEPTRRSIEEYLGEARDSIERELADPFPFWLNAVSHEGGKDDRPSASMDPFAHVILRRLAKAQRCVASVLALQLGGLYEEEAMRFWDSIPSWWAFDERSKDNPLPPWLSHYEALRAILESRQATCAAHWTWLGINALTVLTVPPQGIFDELLSDGMRLMVGDFLPACIRPQVADSLKYAKEDVQAWLDELSRKESAARESSPDGSRGFLGDANGPQSNQGRDEKAPPTEAREMLNGWREICLAVKRRPTDKDLVRSVNDEHDGPIRTYGKGKKPKVYRDELLQWWNHLEALADDKGNQNKGKDFLNRRSNEKPTGAQPSSDGGMNYGRQGEKVHPDERMHVDKRRKDRRM